MFLRFVVIFVTVFLLPTASKLSLLTNTDCGESHGCWSFPKDCIDEKCHGILKWKSMKPRQFLIEMQAKDVANFEQGRYMAFGFSQDTFMGDDTVLECIIDADGVSGQAYISFNDGPSNIQLLDASQKLLKNKETLLKDGKMVCKFELDMSMTGQIDKAEQEMIYDLSNSTWTLLFATGSTVPSTGEKQIHSLEEGNEFYPWATTEEIRLTESKVVTEMKQ
uniref:DOMON domain-containing protein n=1 Tax=Panagrolaimus sp. JU765 TaxID=591449 RepID=A0AC34PZH3_9BILA